MQSFAYKVRSELCRTAVQRLCCARAEAYGVLLYCNTFTSREIRIITENPEFAACHACFSALLLCALTACRRRTQAAES